jgi:hypothetical protein
MTTTKEKVTIEFIRKKLSKHYGSRIERRLHICEHITGNGSVGSVIFELEGSPPKGYAIFIPDTQRINFYDITGKRFNYFDGIREIDYKNGWYP